MICSKKNLYSRLYSGYNTTWCYDSYTIMTLCKHHYHQHHRHYHQKLRQRKRNWLLAVQNRQLDICKDDLCFELKSKRWNHLNLFASNYYPWMCFSIRMDRLGGVSTCCKAMFSWCGSHFFTLVYTIVVYPSPRPESCSVGQAKQLTPGLRKSNGKLQIVCDSYNTAQYQS